MRGWILFGLLATVAPPAMPLAVAPQREPSVSQLVTTAAAYVANYERALASVIADEHYTQSVTGTLASEGPGLRTTNGEVFFTFATEERQWMAIRDVYEVDGEVVAERGAIGRTLQSVSARQAADYFRRQNSRWNIGAITRNFNEPTIALLVLDAHHRSRFDFKRRPAVPAAGRPAVVLEFQERRRPTLIAHTSGRAIYSKGEITMDAETGTIVHTLITLEIDALKIQLTTDYVHDPKLQLWVPALFRERYEDTASTRRQSGASAGGQKTGQVVECEARYTNYRRFEVMTKVK